MNIFCFVELAQEVDDKTADIKKLAYDVSEKLKSTARHIFLSALFSFVCE
jgi:hypothetical protein